MAITPDFGNIFGQPTGIRPNTSGLFEQPPIGSGIPQASQTGGTIDQLLAMIGKGTNPTADGLGDIASMLGGFSSGKKADRVTEGNFRGDYDQMMLDREANINRQGLDRDSITNRLMLDAQDSRNQNESDALSKLQQTAYLRGGGASQAPTTISLGGQNRTLPTFGFAPRPASAEEMQGATDLQGQIMGRLQEGGSFAPKMNSTDSWNYQPTPVEQYAKPGIAEQIGSYGGAATGILGGLSQIFGPQGSASTAGNVLSGLGSIPGLGGLSKAGGAISKLFGGGGAGGAMSGVMGKALPIAGAVTGGIGLIKDQGIGKNMMNGATSGAGIGSMVMPGLGTAVGAGIGAGVGALRSAFGGGPSQQELAGRDTATQARQTITSGATPQQTQEAQAAGWKNPQDALALIVLRDKLAQNGGSPEMANQLIAQLHQAEKGGPQAIEQAVAQIMKAVQGNKV